MFLKFLDKLMEDRKRIYHLLVLRLIYNIWRTNLMGLLVDTSFETKCKSDLRCADKDIALEREECITIVLSFSQIDVY